MTYSKAFAVFAAMALFAATILLGDQPARAEDLGPAVGTTIPDIGTPLDQNEVARTLEDLSGENGLVLLFYRSAGWCPFCQAQLIELNDALADIEARGYKLAAMSYDAPDVLNTFTQKQNINYTLLSDPGSEVIRRFDIVDPQYPEGSMAHGVPRPIIFLLDPSGLIEAKHFEETYRTRTPIPVLLEMLDDLTS